MSNEEIYNELKALRVKAFALSKKDKEFIREASKVLNVAFNPLSRCEDCYRDQIIILTIEVKKYLTVIENESSVYKMVNNKSINWRGVIINNETVTDEIAEKFIKNVKNWFIFIEKK